MGGMEIRLQLKKVLDEYCEQLDDTFIEAVDRVTQETVQKLKDTSPVGAGKKGHYKDGWTSKKSGKMERVIYNAKKPGLTHLLNNGHPVRNQYGSYDPKPGDHHITNAEEWANQELINEVERRL